MDVNRFAWAGLPPSSPRQRAHSPDVGGVACGCPCGNTGNARESPFHDNRRRASGGLSAETRGETSYLAGPPTRERTRPGASGGKWGRRSCLWVRGGRGRQRAACSPGARAQGGSQEPRQDGPRVWERGSPHSRPDCGSRCTNRCRGCPPAADPVPTSRHRPTEGAPNDRSCRGRIPQRPHPLRCVSGARTSLDREPYPGSAHARDGKRGREWNRSASLAIALGPACSDECHDK